MALIPLSQKDPRWANHQLGRCPNETFASGGCVITGLATIAGLNPVQINDKLLNNYGYSSGCLVNWAKAAILLGLDYDVNRTSQVFDLALAETNHYAPKAPQHFFIIFRNGRIIDPLDGKEKANPYRIVSYRNIGRRVYTENGDEVNCNELRKVYEETRTENDRRGRVIEEKDKELAFLNRMIREKDSLLINYESQIKELRQTNDNLGNDNADLIETVKISAQKADSLSKDIRDLEARLKDLENNNCGNLPAAALIVLAIRKFLGIR